MKTLIPFLFLISLVILTKVDGHSAGPGDPCDESQDTNHTLHCDPSQNVTCIDGICEKKDDGNGGSSLQIFHVGFLVTILAFSMQ